MTTRLPRFYADVEEAQKIGNRAAAAYILDRGWDRSVIIELMTEISEVLEAAGAQKLLTPTELTVIQSIVKENVH